MFLYEKDLKEIFWKRYNYKGRALRYQFECALRDGNADLVTVEKYGDEYQFNAFEFKLSDIKKAFKQAEANLKFVNKSWIVVPIEKEKIIKDRYLNYLKEKQYIGVLGVKENGYYETIYQPYFQKEPLMSQQLIKLCMVKL